MIEALKHWKITVQNGDYIVINNKILYAKLLLKFG